MCEMKKYENKLLISTGRNSKPIKKGEKVPLTIEH